MSSNQSHSGDASESRRQAAELLRETQDYLALVAEATQIGMFDWDLLTDKLVWTRQHEIILGYSPTTATIATHAYRDWADRVHPDDLPWVAELIRRGIAERTFQTAEYRVVWPDGSLHWVSGQCRAYYNDEGRAIRVLGAIQDITARKQSVETALTAKAKLEAALASTADAVFISDGKGRFVDFNEAFATFNKFGSKEECSAVCSEYHDILDLYMAHGEPAPWDQWPVPRALRGEVATNVEYALRRKDTGATWVGSFSFAPIRDRNQEIVGAVVGARDITERKQAEEALQQMQAQLAHAARLSTLGEMVAGLAHELNQPLYAILNFSRASRNLLAVEGPPDLDSLREWNEEITAIASSAGEIVRRLRAFARRAKSPRTACRMEEIVAEALILIAAETQRNRVTVEVFPAADAPRIEVDRVQIQQVLVNLLSNAVEAMLTSPVEMRRITIRTLLRATEVEIAVADRGIGLPPDGELKIFNAFVTTKPDGLGMGLSIVRTIVEAHGGKVWASPNHDGGSVFHFTLPLVEGAPPA